jgi:uncharacterized protein (DUF983 family)
MCAQNAERNPGLLTSILSNKCPRCREGNLFTNPNPYALKTTMKMPESCPVCGQRYELHTGFYFGTGFVSYAITVALSAVTFVAWWFTIGMSIRQNDNRLFWWLGLNALFLVALQPLLQRLARSLWITFFVRYNAGWRHTPAH